MRTARLIIVGVTLLSLIPGTATGTKGEPMARSADVVRSCSGNYRFGDTDIWYGDLSVRNMTCRRGKIIIKRNGYLKHGKAKVAGWRCRLIGYYGDGGIYRCTRGDTAMRFSAGG